MVSKGIKQFMTIGGLIYGLSGNIQANSNEEIIQTFNLPDNAKDKTHISDYRVQDNNTPDKDYYLSPEDFSKKNLESIAFDSIGIEFLKEWISSNTFIETTIVDRQTFNNYKGDFLVKKPGLVTAGQQEYTLYLPDSMKISELPSIIKRVNFMTYGEQIPNYASTIEIKNQIAYAIQHLLSIKTEENRDEIQKAIGKYYQLFEQYFPGEKPNIISSEKSIDQEYFDMLNSIKSDENMVKNIEDILATSLHDQFLEAFFEMGSNMLGEIGNIKKTVGINTLMQQLNLARKSGNKETISNKEKEISNKIVSALNVYYEKNKYNKISDDLQQSKPVEIIKNDMANCVGLSSIAHELLNELGINHDARILFGHIALSINTANGKVYYFDPKTDTKIYELSVILKNGNSEEIQANADTFFTIKGDADRFLMASILYNKAKDDETNIKDKIAYMEKSVHMGGSNISIFWYVLANTYSADKQYEKALFALENATKLSPDKRQFRYEKRNILGKLKIFDKRYLEAEQMVKKYKNS